MNLCSTFSIKMDQAMCYYILAHWYMKAMGISSHLLSVDSFQMKDMEITPTSPLPTSPPGLISISTFAYTLTGEVHNKHCPLLCVCSANTLRAHGLIFNRVMKYAVIWGMQLPYATHLNSNKRSSPGLMNISVKRVDFMAKSCDTFWEMEYELCNLHILLSSCW